VNDKHTCADDVKRGRGEVLSLVFITYAVVRRKREAIFGYHDGGPFEPGYALKK